MVMMMVLMMIIVVMNDDGDCNGGDDGDGNLPVKLEDGRVEEADARGQWL